MKKKYKNIITLVSCLILMQSCFTINVGKDKNSPLKESLVKKGESSQKLLLLDLVGEITLSSQESLFSHKINSVQQIASRLERARHDRELKAVVLRINSPGGGVTASEMLYHEIKKFRKSTKKPIYAYVVNMAASGGYYVAMACDKIFAPSSALVGSIGVVNFQPELTELSKKMGVRMNVTKSGRNKDMSSMFRKSTKEEKRIKQEMVDSLAKDFISHLSSDRKIKDKEKLNLISTARIFLAEKALNLGLVDKVLKLDEAIDYVIKENHLLFTGRPNLVAYKGTGNFTKGIYNFSSHFNSIETGSKDFFNLTNNIFKSGFFYLYES